ncbi:MAG: glycerol uptake facilitator protein [Phycisphaerales bacterium]|jgi:glycerol uptake facilitator protein|nr:glycerol uptake facilitator protein [Phycisphaerales bacterium]
MHPFLAEIIGTAILVILGNGVVANVVLNRTKGHGGGWIVITAGWGMAVFVAVFCVSKYSGAHLNPAVTIAMAAAEKLSLRMVPMYLAAQMLGGIIGGMLVYFFYREHYNATDDADAKLATFATAPNIRNLPWAFFCEVVGTFMLVLPLFFLTDPSIEMGDIPPEHKRNITLGLGAIGALPVGLLVFAIGMSLGGTTGYAINPARDLGPRIAHAILPIKGKRDSDWGYAWIPVVAPIVGGLIAALVARLIL